MIATRRRPSAGSIRSWPRLASATSADAAAGAAVPRCRAGATSSSAPLPAGVRRRRGADVPRGRRAADGRRRGSPRRATAVTCRSRPMRGRLPMPPRSSSGTALHRVAARHGAGRAASPGASVAGRAPAAAPALLPATRDAIRRAAGAPPASARARPACPDLRPALASAASTSTSCAATSRSCDERVHGRPLVWLDNAATTQKPQAVIDRLVALLRARELEHPPRRAHAGRARDRRLRRRAREGARASSTPPSSERDRLRARRDRGASTSSPRAGAGATSARATRSSSPGSSTTPTSCPGSSCAPEKGARAARRAGRRPRPGHPRGVREAARPADAARRVHAGLERARHDHAGAARWSRWRTATARACWSTARRRSRTCAVDVQALDCDFYVFSGHKVFAPDRHRRRSTARRDVLDAMPPWQGGGNMIAGRHVREDRLPAGRRARFEAGTGNIADAVGLGAALDYVERDRHRRTSPRYEHELLDYATAAPARRCPACA